MSPRLARTAAAIEADADQFARYTGFHADKWRDAAMYYRDGDASDLQWMLDREDHAEAMCDWQYRGQMVSARERQRREFADLDESTEGVR